MRPVPEVVIKVVSRGSGTLEAIRVHIETMGKGRHRALEDDQGEPVQGRAAAERLIEDWNLDLEVLLGRSVTSTAPRPKPLKLGHKRILSMPAETAPDRLLMAARHFV